MLSYLRFGILLWRLITGEIPFSKFSSRVEFIHHVTNGGRLQIPDSIPSPITSLIEKCWDHVPDERPPFIEVNTIFFY